MANKKQVVLFWVDTQQVSTEDLHLVKSEDRYVGATTTVKFGSKSFKAVVRLISSNKAELEAEEEKVSLEIDVAQRKKKEEQESSNSRRPRPRQNRSHPTGVASDKAVSSALGERIRPPPELASKAKQIADAKKASEKAQRDAQEEIDNDIVNSKTDRNRPPTQKAPTKRALFDNDEKASDSDEDVDGAIDNIDNESETVDSSEDEGSVQLYNSDDEEQREKSEHDNSACCIHCLELKKACGKAAPVFLKAVLKFACGNASVTKYAELLPIPDKTPKCEISKGSKIFISNADKNELKKDGDGDPGKMTRMCLNILYGREQLGKNQVTAKGTRQGQLGIHPNVRKAVRAFVNRNVQAPFQPLDEAEFNRVINRKNCQLHRVSSSKKGTPSSRKPTVTPKSSKKGAANAKRKPPAVQQLEMSPVKTVSPNVSPVKTVTPRKSPGKSGTGLDSSKSDVVVSSPLKPQWTVSRMTSEFSHKGNPATGSSYYPAYSQEAAGWPYGANSYQGSHSTSSPGPSYLGQSGSTSSYGQPGMSCSQGSAAQPGDNWFNYNNLTTLY